MIRIRRLALEAPMSASCPGRWYEVVYMGESALSDGWLDISRCIFVL